jgi:hypothetical protein
MEVPLEKIDLIRKRTGLSYAEAREVLDEAGGDVLEALVILEEEQVNDESRDFLRNDILSPVKRLIRQSNRARIRVKNNDGTLLEIPATFGLAGMFLAPKMTALGAAALLMAHYSLEVDPPDNVEIMIESDFERTDTHFERTDT